MNIEKIMNLCADFLEDSGVEYDKDELKMKIMEKFYQKEAICEDDLNLQENNLALLYVDSDEGVSNAKAVLDKKKETESGHVLIALILVSSMKYQKKVESFVKKMKSTLSIKIQMVGSSRNSPYTIQIVSRISSVNNRIEISKSKNESNEEIESVKAHVFSARLADIVKLYDEIGDVLFKKNVRLKVDKDAVDLGANIKKTLKDFPEQFWFFNNGITIVTNKELRLDKTDSIQLYQDKDTFFSIVNGAQTVSSAHEFMCDDNISADIRAKASESAYVLLRVVSVKNFVKDNDTGNIKEAKIDNREAFSDEKGMFEKISIGLNRQKPITSDDLAYFTKFVKQINKLYDDEKMLDETVEDDRLFYLVRRGEDKNSINKHQLPLVARALRASGYLENDAWKYCPWKAVNTYNADVLRTDETSSDLTHTELFAQFDGKKGYLKRYQYVNLAIYIYRKYDEMKSRIDLDEYVNKNKISEMLGSGGWYFVSFFFKCILERKNQTLKARWIESFNSLIPDDVFVSLMRDFMKIIDDYDGEITRKRLRQASLFDDIFDNIHEDDELKRHIDKVKELLEQNTDVQRYKHVDYEAIAEVRGGKCYILKGSRIEISNDEERMPNVVLKNRQKFAEFVDSEGIVKQDIEQENLDMAARFIAGKIIRNANKKWRLEIE